MPSSSLTSASLSFFVSLLFRPPSLPPLSLLPSPPLFWIAFYCFKRSGNLIWSEARILRGERKTKSIPPPFSKYSEFWGFAYLFLIFPESIFRFNTEPNKKSLRFTHTQKGSRSNTPFPRKLNLLSLFYFANKSNTTVPPWVSSSTPQPQLKKIQSLEKYPGKGEEEEEEGAPSSVRRLVGGKTGGGRCGLGRKRERCSMGKRREEGGGQKMGKRNKVHFLEEEKSW